MIEFYSPFVDYLKITVRMHALGPRPRGYKQMRSNAYRPAGTMHRTYASTQYTPAPSLSTIRLNNAIISHCDTLTDNLFAYNISVQSICTFQLGITSYSAADRVRANEEACFIHVYINALQVSIITLVYLLFALSLLGVNVNVYLFIMQQ